MPILSKIPVWVLPLFIGLVFLGIRQSRTRIIAPGTFTAVAIAMLVFSVYGVVTTFGFTPVAVLGWTTGVVAAVLCGKALFGPSGLTHAAHAVSVPGSWVPLVLLLSVFVAKFVLGFATAVQSPVVVQPWFVATASLALGVLSGGFTSRALVVRRFAKTLPTA
jgi:uncharacterized protein with PQ loop repeat